MVDFVCGPSKDWDMLLRIMELLRSDQGCPWDREQTHQSIRRNLIEECYEVLEAIDMQDKPLLREELGDVLLQVVFHAQIAREVGDFSIEDVITGLCEKLIVRHPHIFGEVKAEDSQAVLQNWDAIKRKSKNQDSVAQSMRHMTKGLPALMRASKVVESARKAGFSFSDTCRTRSDKSNDGLLSVGDALMQSVLAACDQRLDPEEALNHAIDAFIQCFEDWETKERLCRLE